MPHRVPSFTLAPQTTGLPCQLEDSWQRSLNYGLHRDDDTQPWVARSMLKDARAENAWISQLVAPLLARLQPELSSHPSIMVMSDATGLVLETHGNADFLHKAQRYALAPGNLWGEHARGTNAIGTALAMQRHCEVSGGEHYLNRNAGLFCSASPVFRPDGTVAGVLDISTPAQLPKHDAAALIRRAVCQIEHAWAASTVSADRWLLSLHSDASVLGSAQELLLIFEQNTLLGANKLAIDEFCLTPGHFGATAIETLFPGITLNAGETTLEASNCQRYYARQTTPTRRYMGRGVARTPVTVDPEKEKALRIINAGIALCITGETGSGKELGARDLHSRSQWREGNFVAINCAALPENLIESELFGYAPGAFTGANPKGYSGKFREAHGGVLFLDEIGDMPIPLQVKLLRVLQERKVRPLGSNRDIDINVRIISATHRDLPKAMARGEFREDLFYRLNVVNLKIPALAERAEDIPLLANHLLRQAADRHKPFVRAFSTDAMKRLMTAGWPGNVRQLVNVIEQCVALTSSPVISDALVEQALEGENTALPTFVEARNQFELNYLRKLLQITKGNVTHAARMAGRNRTEFYKLLSRHELDANDFKE